LTAVGEREAVIRQWFDMWLRQEDLGIDGMFAEDVCYIESWGPQYEGRAAVRHWFREWNARGKVLVWEIKGYFHREDRTVVEWYFRNQMNDGRVEQFDGLSLVEWTPDNKIRALKEFGCNLDRYDPYRDGDAPQFRDEKTKWF
jgi:hypothetical protein